MKKNLYIGGYSILDLADANVYAQALICAKQNKPVLVYDDPLRYYADTIAIDTDNDDNVVITKGGKTITITDANSVSSEGDIQPSGSDAKLYQHMIIAYVVISASELEYTLMFNYYSTSATQVTTIDEVISILKTRFQSTDEGNCGLNVTILDSNLEATIGALYDVDTANKYFEYYVNNGSYTSLRYDDGTSTTIRVTDVVIEI